MNVLMMVTWYTPQNAEKLQAGIFHNEQAQALKEYCNVAIYYPLDEELQVSLCKKEEWHVLTYRTRFKRSLPANNIFDCMKNKVKLLYNYANIIFKFKKIQKDFKPDIIHANVALGTGIIATIIGKLYKIPVVVSEHQPIEMSNYEYPNINWKLGNYVYGNSCYNTCVSKDLQKKLQSIFPKCKFEMIYNGIMLPIEYKKSKEKYKISNAINIAIVATLYDKEIKGLQYLLPAIKEVNKKEIKVVLHHIGGGQYLDYYKKLARELEITDDCIFYGQCDKYMIQQVISEMDFFVSASLFESAGVSVMEAMIMGKPILATNSGGVDSIVPDFAGMIIEKGSITALVDGIVKMINCLSDYDVEQIVNYAYENFSIKKISEKYISLYDEILQKK